MCWENTFPHVLCKSLLKVLSSIGGVPGVWRGHQSVWAPPWIQGPQVQQQGGLQHGRHGNGSGVQSWNDGSCSLQQPPSHPQFFRFLMLSVGSLAEDPEKQSCQLSLVLAAGIPVHFLWARFGLPAPREVAMGVVWL